ncbi:MAG: CxxxxCH/CxxCH domain-containing protein [Myxococcota bacterium]
MNKRTLAWCGLALLFGGACDDVLFTAPEPPPPVGGDGYCAVRDLFAADCYTCHAAAVRLGDLDLETDPAAALVNVTSAAYGVPLVVPGDSAGSLLVQKITNTQGDLGTDMPPASGGLSTERAGIVKAWIDAGATTDCTDVPVVERYHPEGYQDPANHGPEAKLQTERCVDCHGLDLLGGTALACVTCHGAGWDTDCSFCHGSDPTGVPPRDIDDEFDPALSSFPPHRAHTTPGIGPGFDCVECHLKPTSALSDSHVFLGDPTPGVAEVRFFYGRAPAATYDGLGCSNVYCHGDGRQNGAILKSDGPRDCGSCHAGPATLAGLSQPHLFHAAPNRPCATCHGATVDDTDTIVAGTTTHVNTVIDVDLPPEVAFTNGTCTGTCHGQPHTDTPWAP